MYILQPARHPQVLTVTASNRFKFMRGMSLVLETIYLGRQSYQGSHPATLSHLVLTISRLMTILPIDAGPFWLRAELLGCDCVNLNFHPLAWKCYLRSCRAWRVVSSRPNCWESSCNLGHPPASFFSNRPDPTGSLPFPAPSSRRNLGLSSGRGLGLGLGLSLGLGLHHLPASRDGTLNPAEGLARAALPLKLRCHKAELFRNDPSCHRF